MTELERLEVSCRFALAAVIAAEDARDAAGKAYIAACNTYDAAFEEHGELKDCYEIVDKRTYDGRNK